MRRVLFYTQPIWAFGSIHQALCKELYRYGIHADLLSWLQPYSADEWNHLNSVYDIFVTNPEAVMPLHGFGIPLNKIVAVAHAQWDLYLAREQIAANSHYQQTDQKRTLDNTSSKNSLDFLNELHGFSVISPILVDKSQELGVTKKPKITPLGIHFDLFYSDIHSQLKNVGYAGVKTSYNFVGVEIKRGHLTEQAINTVSDLRLVTHAFYHYLCMPAYYQQVDCIIQSSLEEAGGLPAMEGAAAGRLIIGTPVGYLRENGDRGAGILVPLDETEFVNKTIETLTYYRDNPTEYRHRCESMQQFARENYDWSVVIKNWVEVLE